MISVYHNPRCKKSRAGLQYIIDKGLEHKIILYLKDEPFNEASLKEILLKLNLKPAELLRKQEDIYKKQIKGKNLNDQDLIGLMLKNPKLIQRPIIDNGTKAVIADPAEKAEEVL